MGAKLLVVNHFALATVCGTTVMFREVLRLARRAAPGVAIAYESYEPYASAAALRARLDDAHADAAAVVVGNAHIEVGWELTEAVFAWCRDRDVPAYVYAFDYWPHHKDTLVALTTRYGGRIIASTPFITDTLDREGFHSELIEIGIPLPDAWPAATTPSSPKTLASAGRLVPRKRLADIARAFARSGLDGTARLYLRVLPSNVFSAEDDRAQLGEIEAEIERARLTGVTLDTRAGEPPDYASYAAYVCASSYEGFSMTVIEAAFHGCPPLMSDIPPHRRTANALFGEAASDFVFPVSDDAALAALMRDEIATGRRKALVDRRLGEIRATIAARWSLDQTTRALARLVSA